MSKVARKKALKVRKTRKRIFLPVGLNRRKELRFELPLPIIVEGKLPLGKRFKEAATLKNISSGGAYFCLGAGLVVGTKLTLTIDVPEALNEDRALALRIAGKIIRLEKAGDKGRRQGVAVRFQKKYAFVSVRGQK
jgi:c-di-GMP-binding flagellar brake protein YcgR